MKLLCIGLDETTIHFLRKENYLVEDLKDEDFCMDDYVEYIKEQQFNAVIGSFDFNDNINVYTPRVLRKAKLHTIFVGISFIGTQNLFSEKRAKFLENGGDDLVSDPPNPRELIATLESANRRLNNDMVITYAPIVMKTGDYTIIHDLRRKQIFINGKEVYLTKSEYTMTVAFFKNPSSTLSKEALMKHLYSTQNGEVDIEIKIVDVLVCKLRKAFKKHMNDTPIVDTVWGHGYILNKDVEFVK